MPIKIKITSKGEDISEYGPTGGGQLPSDLKNSGDNTADSSDKTADSSNTSADSSKTSADSSNTSADSSKTSADSSNKSVESSEKTAEIGASSSSSVNKSSEKDSKSLSADSTNAEDPMDTEPAGSQINYEYEGDDTFYTDAQTQVRYKWDKDENCWKTEDGGTALPPGPQVNSADYEFDGDTYVYRDSSGVKHKWNKDGNQWDKQQDSEESEEDDNTTEEERKARQYRKRKAAPGWEAKKYEKDPETGKTVYKDPQDGLTYEWDEDKKAWFPQLAEEFMAAYQLNYGFTNDLESKPTVPEPVVEKPPPPPPKPKLQKGQKKEVEPPKWFDVDEKKCTKVYVSGLPSSVTDEEYEELMAKCGMIEHDVRTKKSKLKLYKDEKGVPKGDGLCSYIKPESVQLALTILDGSDFKGNTLSVERAKFEMKGEAYDPKLKPKKLSKRDKEKALKQKERLFAWVPDKMKGERAKHDKVIVIKNLFDPAEFRTDPGLIIDYTSRIRSQCSKFGTCTKVCIYDKHEEGICQVFFKDPCEADLAVQMLDGRLFGKRIMAVQTWDGRTKYKKNETEEEEKERLAQWEKFLQGEEDTDKAKKEETEEKKKENEEENTVRKEENTARKEEKKKKDEKENSDNCKENESPSEDMETN